MGISASRTRTFLALSFALATTAAPGQILENDRARLQVAFQINDAYDLANEGRYGAAQELLDRALASPHFAMLDIDTRSSGERLKASLALARGDAPTAYNEFVRLRGVYDDSPEIVGLIVESSLRLDMRERAAEALRDLANNWPEDLDLVEDDIIARTLDLANDPAVPEALFGELLAALNRAIETTGNLGLCGRYWTEYLRIQAERGRVEAAAIAFEQPLGVRGLIGMEIDRRFDTIVAAYRHRFDLGAAMTEEIEFFRRYRDAKSNAVAPVVALSQSLRRANQLGEALTLIDETANKVFSPDTDPRAWVDIQDQASWLLNERAHVLFALGMFDEAVLQMAEAAKLHQSGRPNVSQAINLGLLHLRLGRTDQAADAVRQVTGLSDYGEMLVHHIALGAAVAEGNERGVRRELEVLADLKQASPPQYQVSLMLTDQMDAAAAVLIERLNDEDLRIAALISLQRAIRGTADLPNTPEYDRKIYERVDALIARPDVRAAIDRVGRINSYPFRLE